MTRKTFNAKHNWFPFFCGRYGRLHQAVPAHSPVSLVGGPPKRVQAGRGGGEGSQRQQGQQQVPAPRAAPAPSLAHEDSLEQLEQPDCYPRAVDAGPWLDQAALRCGEASLRYGRWAQGRPGPPGSLRKAAGRTVEEGAGCWA